MYGESVSFDDELPIGVGVCTCACVLLVRRDAGSSTPNKENGKGTSVFLSGFKQFFIASNAELNGWSNLAMGLYICVIASRSISAWAVGSCLYIFTMVSMNPSYCAGMHEMESLYGRRHAARKKTNGRREGAGVRRSISSTVSVGGVSRYMRYSQSGYM